MSNYCTCAHQEEHHDHSGDWKYLTIVETVCAEKCKDKDWHSLPDSHDRDQPAPVWLSLW
jgi:hypothetical protein